MGMEWQRLLSRQRLSHRGTFLQNEAQTPRSAFERDWDRILFSNAFRRLHDKTQVFPLPDNDVVHSRLTHSLEVASVGRSLGRHVGRTLLGRHAALASHVDVHDIGDIVAAGCLAHDIGNPPFGHAGERAIASFFQSEAGRSATKGLGARETTDLEHFEGNAQGFRILTRLQLEADGGLHLTAATLAAFTKYPRASGPDLKVKGVVGTKKHGFVQADIVAFSALAEETGLLSLGDSVWARHPLAYLVETADDICYSILDIEDGARLGHVAHAEVEARLRGLASLSSRFDEGRINAFSEPMDRIGYLRALAIGRLIDQAASVFLDKETQILDGTHGTSLADDIPNANELQGLKNLAFEKCYRAADVLEIELAGFEALGGLLGMFATAAAFDDSATDIPERFVRVRALLERRGVPLKGLPLYERLVRVADHVSGMTDRHALATFRRLTGIAIPGRPS